MAVSYTRITVEEFESFLNDFVSFDVVQTDATEKVYTVAIPRDGLEVRIFSTLQGGEARNCGDDAIRTVLWHTEYDEPVGGMTKTLRVETWESNLRPKIQDLVLNWRDHFNGHCPVCGNGVLKTRSGEFGDFLGCSNYPVCDHTESV